MKGRLAQLLELMPAWAWRIVASLVRLRARLAPSPRHGRTLIVLDPSYRSTVGHHHALNRLLIETCDANGLKVMVLANRYLHSTLASHQVRPAFRCDVYDESHSMHAFAQRRERTQRQVLVELALCGVADTGAEVSVLVHTATAIEVSAILEALRRLNVKSTINVFLMFPPQYSVDPSVVGAAERLYRQAQASALAAQRVHFWCDGAGLVNRFKAIGMTALRYHALPSMVPDIAPVPRHAGPGALVALFIGDARHEKGAELVGQALRLLSESTIPIIIRLRLTSISQELQRHIDRSRAGLVDLKLMHFIPSDVYFREIAAADFVLLPYDPVAYRTRSSNIAAEATAMGTPAIVPPRPNALLDFYDMVASGSCIEMPTYDAAGLVAALSLAIQADGATRKAAAKHSQGVRAQRDALGFLRDMT